MRGQYAEVTARTVAELRALLGRGCVFTGQHQMEECSRDESPHAEPHMPRAVVKPADTRSVAKLLEFANRERIPVTPRGAGTGVSGGCVPVYGGIVLSLERMNRILEVDERDFVAVAEAGVTLAELCAAVEQRGLYYPLYPGEMTATVGGNIATNAGGMNAVKYGVTRHNLLGVEAVLPGGEVIATGGRFVKCSTGYDLTQLIAGSEGTLAVVAGATLKLTLRPLVREVLFAPFTKLQDAIDAVPDILGLGSVPAGIEFMERSIIQIVEEYTGRELPHHGHDAFLMVIMEGDSQPEIYDYFSQVEAVCKRHGAVEAMVPHGQRARRRLLDAREKFYHALKRHAPMQLIDVVVPRSRIGEFVRQVKRISREHEIPIIIYGHAGDGNVHLHPVRRGLSQREWDERLPRLMREIYRAGVSLGGAISGEHGIGLDKREYFADEADAALLCIMREIKRAFDPNNILNPGKVLDMSG